MSRLQSYDFRIVCTPEPGNIADPLSRLLRNRNEVSNHKHGAEEYVRFVAINATPKALTTREVEEASAMDEELTILKEAIRTGRFKQCKAYAPAAGELCVTGRLVLRGNHIVLPNKLRPQAGALAHERHLGMVGTKQNLRSKVWWPAMDKAAEKFCKSCHGCQLVARPASPETLRSTTLPEGPWKDLADQVLVTQEKTDKLSGNSGNSVVVESQGGAQYSRNAAHVKKFVSDLPETTPMTPAVASGAPTAAESAPMMLVDSGSKGEATTVNTEVAPNPVTTPRIPTPNPVTSPGMLTASGHGRPQRQRRLPVKYKDLFWNNG